MRSPIFVLFVIYFMILQNTGQHLVHVLVPLGVTAALRGSRMRLLPPQHRGRMVPEPLAHGAAERCEEERAEIFILETQEKP